MSGQMVILQNNSFNGLIGFFHCGVTTAGSSHDRSDADGISWHCLVDSDGSNSLLLLFQRGFVGWIFQRIADLRVGSATRSEPKKCKN
jgi:hypothetical protein